MILRRVERREDNMTDYTDTLNEFGLTAMPPPAQITSVAFSNTFAPSSISGSTLVGALTNRLVVGNAANPDSAVYIDVSNSDKTMQGIWAGSAVYATADFSVNILGQLIANLAIIRGLIETASSGQRIAMDPAFGTPIPVPALTFYDNTGTLVGLIYAIPGKMVIGPNLAPESAQITINDFAVNIKGQDSISGGVNLGVGDGSLPFGNNAAVNLSPALVFISTNDNSGNSSEVDFTPTNTSFPTPVFLNGGGNVQAQAFTTTGAIDPTKTFIFFGGTLGGTLTLPLAAANGPGNCISLYFKDGGNNSSVNNIILAAQAGDTVEFGADLTVNVDGIGFILISDGQNEWYVVGLS